MDDHLHEMNVKGNTAAYCKDSSLFLHNTWSINVESNTLYASPSLLSFQFNSGSRLYNNTFEGNILVASERGQIIINEPSNPEITATYLNNLYCDPFSQGSFRFSGQYLSFNDWMARPSIDVNSKL